ncbi:FtsQ-type POTRA domain-containing protein [Saxibacter everestensis]|uniref:FtsQ-type POTRA domain-containing protein n=1 Tax=Saxibacter everestensis TaxID=2909229 RepID=A0ABY8QWF4_9MICO|nr:FtsQ-type POTRA domain-containing protein [Brevibacteriaceae bacterium ZFBP1038]
MAGQPISLEAKRDAARRRKRRNIWITIAAAAALLGLAAVAFFSPVLACKSVTVTGTDRLDQAEVRKSVSEEYQGTPLPRLTAKSVGEFVAEAYPLAASVRVDKQWPHGLRVRVVERQPIAALRAKSGFDLVDGTGFTVDTVAKAPKGLPVLDVNVRSAGVKAVTAALIATSSLTEDLQKDLKTVSAKSATSVELTMKSGTRIRWGSAEESDLKAKVAGELLKQKPEYIDVSVPKAPTTK